jgi:hypothetical protein
MTQAVEHLPSKMLSLNPDTTKKKTWYHQIEKAFSLNLLFVF